MGEEIKKFRESAVMLRKTADLFDKCANIMEDENLNENEKEEMLEETMGRLVINSLKAQSIFE